MNPCYVVCSYNIGGSQGYGDYFQHGSYQKAKSKGDPEGIDETLSEEEIEQHKEAHTKVEKRAAEALVGKVNAHSLKIDAFCLQEFSFKEEGHSDKERPFVSTLKKHKFTIIHANNSKTPGPAIALNSERFTNIENFSEQVPTLDRKKTREVAIARARDSQTGESVVFVSAHTPGYDITKDKPTDQDTEEGDDYCAQIAQKLAVIGGTAIQIIGADMNGNPEKSSTRFDHFKAKGFQVMRTGTFTNVNMKDKSHKEREIDFIFVKARKRQDFQQPPLSQSTFSASDRFLRRSPHVEEVFMRRTGWTRRNSNFSCNFNAETLSNYPKDQNWWSTDTNASDHRPIFVKITRETVSGL